MSLRLDVEARAQLRELEAARRAIQKPLKEAARLERKALQKARPKRDRRVEHEKVRERRERDVGYLTWLHQDLPCIACLVLGPPAAAGPIEAAHQKINAPSRGVHKRLGVRPSDLWCVPLCVAHHRTGSPCCDPAQAKFWAVVGLSPDETADFCLALYAAYERQNDGAAVVRDFASLAAGNRADAA